MFGRLKDLTMNMDGTQNITITVKTDFRGEFDGLKDKDLDIEIKRHRKRRSLDANAYCWVLIGKIAEKMHVGKLEVYRNTIRDIRGVSSVCCVQVDQVDQMKKYWEGHGLGWQMEVFDSKIPGCKNAIFYAGSSEFDTAAMSELIDHLVQDAKALGIETMTPAEIKRLEDQWSAHYQKGGQNGV